MEQALKAWSLQAGTDYFGVADLSQAYDEVVVQSNGLLTDFPRAVVLGIGLPDAIVDLLPRRAERAVAVQYHHHAYDVINIRLDQLASRLASRLQNEGYRAFPMAASERVDDERISALFSHKLAARLAGLGWIGKNCLLITPDRGPRVRWITVLTNAPLAAAASPLPDGCSECRECVQACPQQAFTDRAFRADEPREARFNVARCDRYCKTMKQQKPWFVCGMCLYACPYGKKTGLTGEGETAGG